MFIRKRLSMRALSYQVIETYRDGRKVKQRVLANLGRHDSVEAALEAARQEVALWGTLWRMKGLARSRERMAKLEAVVSTMSRRRDIADTTHEAFDSAAS